MTSHRRNQDVSITFKSDGNVTALEATVDEIVASR